MQTILSWIDLDDGLPPEGVDVLIACADGVQQGVLRTGGFRSYLRGQAQVHDVTHWMALPTHPLNEVEDAFTLGELPVDGRRGVQRLM